MAKTEAELRRDRLKAALRENLKRRKAQARARTDASGDADDGQKRSEDDR